MNTLWQEPWWVWRPESAGVGDWVYRLFNLFEGLVWVGFGLLVIRRWMKHRRSWAELSYAIAFAAFGVTDFREAYVQSISLIAIKGVVLVWLMATRYRATRVWYPGAKLY